MTTTPTIRLRSGLTLPQVGFGTWPLRGEEGSRTILSALEAGYRLIDTAENYRNEDAVGAAIRQSGIPREEIVVTTKFNREWHSHDGVREALSRSLERLGLDRVEILLIHWPNPDQDQYVEAFEGMLALQEEGLVQSIGTSNFLPHHLERLRDHGYIPEVNQLRMDPLRPRTEERQYMAEHGIVLECWSPLGQGRSEVLDRSELRFIADTHGVTPAQVVLRWQVQLGYVTIPKASTPERQKENLEIMGFGLNSAELQVIASLADPDAPITSSDEFGH